MQGHAPEPRRGTSHPLADRRLDYARALLAEGDAAAAADLARQALELVPDAADIHFVIGEAEQAAGSPVAAAEAFRRCLALDPADRLGAAPRLARLDGTTPASMPPAYVGALFDQYASGFDAALAGRLSYRGPAILADAIERACRSTGRAMRFGRALDLGCGTGLAGAALRPAVEHLEGVDLSRAMLRVARGKRVYDALRSGDVTADLAAAGRASLDMVLAADVLVYLGDLEPLVSAAAQALAPGGLFAFTVERHDGPEPFVLGAKLRYAHGRAHLLQSARNAYLRPVLVEDCSTRREAGVPVPGLIAVFARP